MKVKLLKKIRKQYSIVYYPYDKRYEIKHPDKYLYYRYLFPNWTFTITLNKTKEQAISNLLKMLRLKYYKYSRKHKLSKVSIKVWHNA